MFRKLIAQRRCLIPADWYYTVLTTAHDRMPLIVAPEDAPRWLDREVEDVIDLLRP